MTEFTDKYGRTWNHQPGHDTDRMLQIDPDFMLKVYNFRLPSNIPQKEAWPVPNPDCYLLKGKDDWNVGIRLSDEGNEYISPFIEDELITYMIRIHGQHLKRNEYEPYLKLVKGLKEFQ